MRLIVEMAEKYPGEEVSEQLDSSIESSSSSCSSSASSRASSPDGDRPTQRADPMLRSTLQEHLDSSKSTKTVKTTKPIQSDKTTKAPLDKTTKTD